MTNPAIEAVHRYLLSQPLEQLTTDGARRVAVDLITAVLDNLPRGEMLAAILARLPYEQADEWHAGDALAAAITAARATLLPGDA